MSRSDMNCSHLRADCEKCFGLCCSALYFSASEGFPCDKEAGRPCLHLQADSRCSVYPSVRGHQLKGCSAFDCFGAGQRVAQTTFGGKDWHSDLDSLPKMCDAFHIMRRLHELLWYLGEAKDIKEASSLYDKLGAMQKKIEDLTQMNAERLMELDLAAYRADVDQLLKKVSQNVRSLASSTGNKCADGGKSFRRKADLIGADLRSYDLRGANMRGCCIIAADMRGCDLSGADFIGADFRDADLRGADLSKSIFLTQGQVNAAQGDQNTRLPKALVRPRHWEYSDKP